MVKCPACGTSIDADFGMTSCPQCAAVFMVEMDGSIQELQPEEGEFGEGEQPESTFISPPTDDPEPLNEDMSFGDADLSAPALETEEAEAAFYEENPEAQIEDSTDMIVGEGEESPAEEILAEGSEETPAEYSENFMDDMNTTPEQGAEKGEDPLGVTAFDQSAASLLSDGLYYYDLKVSGLDSSQLRQEVIDALSDPRFDWLPEDLKKHISSGELTLTNLNPIKTVLAVIKLQALDVEVEWTQKLYTDESIQKDPEAES